MNKNNNAPAANGLDAIAKQKEQITRAKKEGVPENIAKVLSITGRMFMQLGNPAEALDYFEQAEQHAIKNGLTVEHLTILGNRAIALGRLGKLEEATACFDEVHVKARELEDKGLACDALIQKAQMNLEANRADVAYGILEEALEMAEKAELSSKLMPIYNLFGQNHLQVASVEEAANYFEKALEIAIDQDDLHALAGQHINLATAYSAGGAPLAAQEHFEKALKIAREQGDEQGERTALISLIKTSAENNDHKSVVNFSEQALTLTIAEQDIHSQILHLNTIVLTLANQGLHQESLPYIEQALETVRRIKDKEKELSLLTNLGNTHFDLDQLSAAKTAYELALELSVRLQDRESQARILGRISAIFAEMGNSENADKFALDALETARTTEKHRLIGEQLMLLAFNHRDREEYQEALLFSSEAKDTFTKIEAPETLEMVNNFIEGLPETGQMK